MEDFNWTPKRRAALEYLVQARGNVRVAAQLSKRGPVSVSYNYLNELKYSEKHKAFREEYHRRTGELLNALEVDTEYVVKGLVELTRPDIPPSTRRLAYRDLGQYVGIWAPQRKEAEVKESEVLEAMRATLTELIDDEPDAARKRGLLEAVELIFDAISRRRAGKAN